MENKMKDSKREELKERLMAMVVNKPPFPKPITMSEVMMNSMNKPNLEPLLDFIDSEISKAKEEGLRMGKEVVDNAQQGLIYDEVDKQDLSVDSDYWLLGKISEQLQSELDKLSNKNKCSGK